MATISEMLTHSNRSYEELVDTIIDLTQQVADLQYALELTREELNDALAG